MTASVTLNPKLTKDPAAPTFLNVFHGFEQISRMFPLARKSSSESLEKQSKSSKKHSASSRRGNQLLSLPSRISIGPVHTPLVSLITGRVRDERFLRLPAAHDRFTAELNFVKISLSIWRTFDSLVCRKLSSSIRLLSAGSCSYLLSFWHTGSMDKVNA